MIQAAVFVTAVGEIKSYSFRGSRCSFCSGSKCQKVTRVILPSADSISIASCPGCSGCLDHTRLGTSMIWVTCWPGLPPTMMLTNAGRATFYVCADAHQRQSGRFLLIAYVATEHLPINDPCFVLLTKVVEEFDPLLARDLCGRHCCTS